MYRFEIIYNCVNVASCHTYNIFLFNKSIYISVPTQESGTDVFGDLVARLARLRKMAQLLVEHPFELEKREENKRIYTRLLQAVA